MYVDGICVINVFIYSWIQSPIFTSFAQQTRRPLCLHHDLLLAARICLRLFQRLACIMERSVVVIWFLWGQKWIVAFRRGTFLFVLIIIFKYCDWRGTDVGPTSAGDINPTSKRRWADIAQLTSTQRRPNTCSLVVFFHSIICQNYFAPKSSQCWKQRLILVQSWHGYRPTVH